MNNLFNMLLGLHEQTTKRTIKRLPFSYYGGKSDSLDKILPKLPYLKGYCEVFGGSGAVLFNREPSKVEVYNDAYGGVVCFYRVVRDPEKVTKLVERVKLALHSREEWTWCRSTWKNCNDEIERAARWYYMIRCSIHGNGRGWARSTEPTTNTAKMYHDSIEFIKPLTSRLRNVAIENLDWRKCIQDYDSEDFVFYLDPPYMSEESDEYEHKMTKADHKELCEIIMSMKGFVALSGYPNEIYDSFNWSSVIQWDRRVKINISDRTEAGKYDLNRAIAKECLYLK